MNLYLVQHGEAKTDQEDPKRPLSDEGRRNTKNSAEIAAKLKIAPKEILHSEKLRAQETAEILGEKLHVPIRQEPGLSPNDSVEAWRDRLAREEKDLLLVGHLPFMERLISLFLAGDKERLPVRFRKGGVVCLEKNGGLWRLLWALWPEMF